MPRHTRATSLETRTARLKLTSRKKPYFTSIALGVALGYRRLRDAGTWTVRANNGSGSRWTKVFAIADDNEDANGDTVLNFWQAQDRARAIARADHVTTGDRPITVSEALANYEAELTARGGDSQNVSRVRHHLPAALGVKTVGLLNARELRQWRDGLLKKGLAPASAGRTARILKAALSLAAREDHRITNTAAWCDGLRSLPDAESARNIILSDDEVRKVVTAAYELNPSFGLWVETHAIVGCRSSQAQALEIRDLQSDATPRLMLPSSKKGRRRRIERRPVPIPASLAQSLCLAAGDRAPHEPLFQLANCRRTYFEWFRRAVAAAGLDPKVSIYALRHSSIVRMLISGTPIRICATHHDTSTAMIERSYSRFIGDHADTMVRRGLLDIAAPAGSNVVPLAARP
jgi:integrase